MGAAQNQHVGTGLQQRLHVAAQQGAKLGAGQIAALDMLDQPRAGLGDHLQVARMLLQQVMEFLPAQRGAGGEDSDHAAARGRHRRLHGRLHADERQRIGRAQMLDRGDRRGVAGDDDQLGSGSDQLLGDRHAACPDLRLGLAAIRAVAAVGEIDQLLGRQLAPDLAQHRQAADAGIEYADRRRAHANSAGLTSKLSNYALSAVRCCSVSARRNTARTSSGDRSAATAPD